MRKSQILLPAIKEKIRAMQGTPIRFAVHGGRNRYKKYTGVLETAYPCVFTVRVDQPVSVALFSFSYNDLLCGNVRIAVVKQKECDRDVEAQP